MAKNDILFVGALLLVVLFAYRASFSEKRVLKADHYEAFVADKLVRSMIPMIFGRQLPVIAPVQVVLLDQTEM
ncbi:hypothetical protein Goshw_017955, partial [Gossypium schwendimanii]|nr:hypothetical protein [Gossypium schwendimanii]